MAMASYLDNQLIARIHRINLNNIKFVVYYLMILNIRTTASIKCVCNQQECDIIGPDDCPGKGLIVWDSCRCCKVCAKVLGEACGGPGDFSGSCEPPLNCVTKPPIIGNGVCLDLPSDDTRIDDCQETIFLESGCEIVNRRCRCWNGMEVCRDKNIKWDFKNLEECQLNLQNLVKTELDFDEDYSMPIKHFEHPKVNKRRKRTKQMSLMTNHNDYKPALTGRN